jgi:antirestriction protein ArdC
MRDYMSEPAKLSVHDAYGAVTNRILELLDKGVVPWHQPWCSGWPQNLFTKREYRGVNVLMLSCRGFTSPYWASERQIEAHGGEVLTEQIDNPTFIYFWRMDRFYTWTKTGFSMPQPYSVVKVHEVFNVEQTKRVERFMPPPGEPLVPIEAVQEIVAAMPQKPCIENNPCGAVYYPTRDVVGIPPTETFMLAEEYYCTLFHELVHATGHPTRLNRKSLAEMGRFGDPVYSQEELVAEMGAAMLCGVTGIAPKTIQNSAAYIQSWLRELKNDKRLLLIASGQAQKACDFIRGKSNCVQSAQNDKNQNNSGGLPTVERPQRLSAHSWRSRESQPTTELRYSPGGATKLRTVGRSGGRCVWGRTAVAFHMRHGRAC